MCVTETSPKNSPVEMSPSEINLEGYDVHVNHNKRRGVAIYTAKYLKSTPIDHEGTYLFEEHCWTKIKLNESDSLLIGCIYRSPNSQEANNGELLRMLPTLCHTQDFSHLLICGDFNLPEINWAEPPTTSTGPESLSAKFLDCTRDCFLWQHVTEPTHKRGQQTSNTLDLVLTNEENMIDKVEYDAPLGKSHHCCLIFKYKCYSEQKKEKKTALNLKRGDYDRLRGQIRNTDFGDLRTTQIEEAWDSFHQKLTENINQCIPRLYFDPSRKRRPEWINTEVLEKVRVKRAAFKQYRTTGDEDDYRKYTRARNQTRWASRNAKRAFERELAEEATTQKLCTST